MSSFDDLQALVKRLRAPDGCPWDRAQDLRTMRPYLLEEAYEVLEAIEAEDPARVKEELGDLLFNVVMLAQIAADEGQFAVDDVPAGITAKMIERHPHVFGMGDQDADAGSIGAWEERKTAAPGSERGRLDGVPTSLPALLRAHRQGEKAAAVGFDWSDAAGVIRKIEEEMGELQAELDAPIRDLRKIEHEYGDLLMAVSSLGRFLGTPPESALQLANDRFRQRFRTMEKLAGERGLTLSAMGPDALEDLWQEAKRAT